MVRPARATVAERAAAHLRLATRPRWNRSNSAGRAATSTARPPGSRTARSSSPRRRHHPARAVRKVGAAPRSCSRRTPSRQAPRRRPTFSRQSSCTSIVHLPLHPSWRSARAGRGALPRSPRPRPVTSASGRGRSHLGVAYLEQFSYTRPPRSSSAPRRSNAHLHAGAGQPGHRAAATSRTCRPHHRTATAAATAPDAPPHVDFVLDSSRAATTREKDALAAFRRCSGSIPR